MSTPPASLPTCLPGAAGRTMCRLSASSALWAASPPTSLTQRAASPLPRPRLWPAAFTAPTVPRSRILPRWSPPAAPLGTSPIWTTPQHTSSPPSAAWATSTPPSPGGTSPASCGRPRPKRSCPPSTAWKTGPSPTYPWATTTPSRCTPSTGPASSPATTPTVPTPRTAPSAAARRRLLSAASPPPPSDALSPWRSSPSVRCRWRSWQI